MELCNYLACLRIVGRSVVVLVEGALLRDVLRIAAVLIVVHFLLLLLFPLLALSIRWHTISIFLLLVFVPFEVRVQVTLARMYVVIVLAGLQVIIFVRGAVAGRIILALVLVALPIAVAL